MDERDGIPHNLIAHPLLILCPPLGRWLHERTNPVVPTRAARWRQTRGGWPTHFHPFTVRKARP